MIPQTFTPNYLKSLQLLKFKARRSFLGMREGGHASIKRGHGIEFADYRKYELGDDLRHIDWGVYARTDKLYLKRFREERDLSLLLLVDATNSMFVPKEDKKWEFARDIALSLGYISLSQQDSVTAAIPGHAMSPAFRGGKAFYQLSSAFEINKPVERSDFLKGISEGASSVRFPGSVVFISDFLMPFKDIERALLILRAKNLDITVVQVLGSHDINPFGSASVAKFIDAETSETISVEDTQSNRSKYDDLLNSHNRQIRTYCNSAQIGYSRVQSNSDLTSFMITELPQTGILER